jgi:mono/diheme cytochrome c family protein
MGTTLSDEQIAFRIRKGRQGFMPGYEGTFSDREIAGLVAYIRALKPR